jgi:hypothetical protein
VAGHLPIETIICDLVESGEWEVDRHSVERLTWGIAVRQGQLDLAPTMRLAMSLTVSLTMSLTMMLAVSFTM